MTDEIILLEEPKLVKRPACGSLWSGEVMEYTPCLVQFPKSFSFDLYEEEFDQYFTKGIDTGMGDYFKELRVENYVLTNWFISNYTFSNRIATICYDYFTKYDSFSRETLLKENSRAII